MAGLSPLPVVAVSLYIESHLMILGTPITQISDVIGIVGLGKETRLSEQGLALLVSG